MEQFTSHNNPTRFISMAATSLDNSLIASPTRSVSNSDSQPQQIRLQKQSFDPINIQTSVIEFQKPHSQLTSSTNSLQSDQNNIESAIFRHNTSSRSLSPILSNKIDKNINNQLQINTSLPLPSNHKSKIEKHQQISSIGSAIDKRLQNLRAKLQQLEQEDKKQIENETNERNNCIPSTNIHISKPKHISKDTAVSLPLINNDTLNTSFARKYEEYMQKYHGNTSTHSYPAYNNIATQNLVSKIKEKSKALFETDIDYKNKNKKNNIPKKHKYKPIPPYITEDDGYDKTIKNFDDELNKTWNRTQLRLKKIKAMNEHFKKRNNFNKKISVTQSITSSHWSIDSTHYENINNTQIPIVYEKHMPISETNNSVNEKSFFTEDTYKNHDSKMDVQNSVVQNVENMESKQSEMDKYVTSVNEQGDKVINLTFNKGIQVRIPVLCSHCNRDLNTNDIAVISLENKRTFVSENMNICNENNNEQKIESNEYENVRYNMSEKANTTMSETDRKQLIMDLKSIDGDRYYNNYGNSDCKSDGMLFEDKYKNRKSLRAKVNDLKINMNQNKSCERKCDDKMKMTNSKNEEYLYLKRKLQIYENKLRNIDPTLLE